MSAHDLMPERQFPKRDFFKWGETGRRAQDALAQWVGGRSFVPNVPPVWESEGFFTDGRRDHAPVLKYEGELRDGYVRWRVEYRQHGDLDSWGMSSGASCAEDAAYSACSMIETHELEQFEAELVLGTA